MLLLPPALQLYMLLLGITATSLLTTPLVILLTHKLLQAPEKCDDEDARRVAFLPSTSWGSPKSPPGAGSRQGHLIAKAQAAAAVFVTLGQEESKGHTLVVPAEGRSGGGRADSRAVRRRN